MKAVEIFILPAFKFKFVVLLQFSILLLLVFILELSGGIAGYVLRDRALDFLSHRLNESMHTYINNTETRKLWYEMQTNVS
jgi:CD63 antigen